MTSPEAMPIHVSAALAAIPDRETLQERFATAVAQAQRHKETLALVVLDLNRSTRSRALFDAAGNELLLATVADHLKLISRRSDVLAYLGNDLFAIVMERVHDTGQILGLTQRLLRLFDGHWELAGQRIHLTPAVGVAVCPEHGDRAQDLFARAVDAAHQAAQRGMHHPLLADGAMQGALERRLTLEADLRRAVECRHLVLHYQPQVEAQSGRVSGFEALVRWAHPERGLVLPDQFIPLAEETGVIVELGASVLEEAARQLAEWADRGHPGVRVAVNFGAEELAGEGLLELVESVLDGHDLPPGQLEVEITERTAIADARITRGVLEELHRRGVRLTLDDFGTGYSSLAVLLDYPFDTLKIDRSVVARLIDGDRERALTGATVCLAHAAGITVVAEGVETIEQLALLRELGTDEIQGFLLARPLPAAECGPFLSGSCELPVAGA